MKKILWGAAVAVMAVFVLLPAHSRAQQAQPVKSDFLMRVGGPAVVGPADTIGTVWVIGSTADIQGNVRDLLVINGSAHITGTVQQNVVIVKGTADLGPAAVVGGDVLLYRSTMTPASGARIGGAIHNEPGVSFGARALWIFWLSITIAFIAAGILTGYFVGQPLKDVADFMRTSWRETILTALVLAFALPAAAVASFMTGIGFVLGFFILFVVIPALCLLGYVVAGTAVGYAFLNGSPETRSKFYSRIAFGILILQLLAVVPVIGGILVLAGSQLGAGALVYTTWDRGRTKAPHSGLIVQPA